MSVSEGDADLPNDNSTSGRVAVGGSATGAIGTDGDHDRFAVELEAGRTYRFDLTGSPGGGGTLPDTFFRAIYNSEGQYQADSHNDDFEGGRDSRVTFTPTESGTYYARVSGDRDETGSYTLSVTDVTPEQGAEPPAAPAASQSKSAYIDAHNARERALDQLLAQTDPSSPGGAANEAGDESKDGKSVGSPQGKAITPRATVNICDRTPEVEAALLARIQANEPSVICSTVTDAHLAGIDDLYVYDYSSSTIIAGDFAGLTGLDELHISNSQQLTTVPANAFSQLTSTNLQFLGLSANQIKTVHPDAFDGLAFSCAHSRPQIALNGNVIETLQAGAFENVTCLKKIDLGHNHIAGFEDGVFAGLSELEHLVLHRNHLKVLPDGLFDGLTELEGLWLNANELTAIGANTFADLSNLETLDLSSGKIASLHPDSFKGLSSLEMLDLQRNAIPMLPAAVFDDLDNLSVLRLTLNEIASLDANTLSGLTTLTELHLGGNNLGSLPATSFQNLTNLTALDLQANDLTSVDEDLFAGLVNLNILRLDGNRLSDLPVDLFDPLDDSLTVLYLHANTLTVLDKDIFDGLAGLGRLALDDNQLTTLPVDIFDPLDDSLVFLWLGGNKFSSLPVGLFDGLSGLLILDMTRAGPTMTTLEPNLFQPLGSNLQLLNLSNNDLTSLDENIFAGLTGLRFLYLHGNGLTSLPVDVFDGLAALERLYLDGNGLTSLHADVLDGLGALGKLRLDDNDLTMLPANLFEGLDESLTDLYLRENELTALPSGIFAGLGGLQRLDLSCNALTALDLGVFDPFAGTLKYLDLGANSFATPPTDAAVNGKLTALEALDLTGAAPCLPAYDVGLSTLSLSSGTLSPVFAPPGLSQYQAMVGHDVSELTITPTTRNPDAVIEPSPGQGIVNDTDLMSAGIQATLTPISTPVRWKVTAKNREETMDYTVLVIREHPPGSVARLRSLDLSGLTLTPEFGSTTDEYRAIAREELAATTVTATALDPDATVVIKLDGVTVAEAAVITVADSSIITVAVTAEDGVTTRTYTVTPTTVTTPHLEGDTDLAGDASTTGVVEVDGPVARGAISEPVRVSGNYYRFDYDWFQVTLQAGRTYRIDLAPVIHVRPDGTYAVPLLPEIVALYDADSDYLHHTSDRESSGPGYAPGWTSRPERPAPTTSRPPAWASRRASTS